MSCKAGNASHEASCSYSIGLFSVAIPPVLTLVMLNKLRCHPTSNFQPIRLLDPDFWYKFTYLIANSADPDQLASSEANWSGSTLFEKAEYIRAQQDKGFAHVLLSFALQCLVQKRPSPWQLFKIIIRRHICHHNENSSLPSKHTTSQQRRVATSKHTKSQQCRYNVATLCVCWVLTLINEPLYRKRSYDISGQHRLRSACTQSAQFTLVANIMKGP